MRFWRLMVEGGWGMWFVLAFGVITLVAAIGYALRPERRRAAAVRAFSRSLLFASISVVSLDLATVGARVVANPDWAHSPDLHLILLEGVSESLAPATLGFTLLSLVWLLVALGERRETGSGAEL
jgi:hypothetical protein